MAPTRSEKVKTITHSNPWAAATWGEGQRHIRFDAEEEMAGGWPAEGEGGAATCLRAADLRPRLQITAAPNGEAAAGATGPVEVDVSSERIELEIGDGKAAAGAEGIRVREVFIAVTDAIAVEITVRIRTEQAQAGAVTGGGGLFDLPRVRDAIAAAIGIGEGSEGGF